MRLIHFHFFKSCKHYMQTNWQYVQFHFTAFFLTLSRGRVFLIYFFVVVAINIKCSPLSNIEMLHFMHTQKNGGVGSGGINSILCLALCVVCVLSFVCRVHSESTYKNTFLICFILCVVDSTFIYILSHSLVSVVCFAFIFQFQIFSLYIYIYIYTVHPILPLLSVFRARSIFNAPKTVTWRQLIVLMAEHCVIYLCRYSVVDQLMNFVFDSSEIRNSGLILVCWCPISRQYSIPAEWAVNIKWRKKLTQNHINEFNRKIP